MRGALFLPQNTPIDIGGARFQRESHDLSSRREEILKRILDRVELDDETGCYIWTGPTSGGGRGGGYPWMSLDGATVAVHRVVYTHYFGLIPPRKQIDHTCRNRLCVNHRHLEMVTQRENCLRRDRARSAL